MTVAARLGSGMAEAADRCPLSAKVEVRVLN